MDRESYENAEVARIINESFIPVKVDRDERPDIDARYQTAVSALTGQGGWPLTAFLTPDGQPFYGGTYFPPDDRADRPGMKRLLEAIAHNYRAHREQIHDSAAKIAEAVSQAERFEEGPRRTERTHCGVQRPNRSAGASELSAGGVAEADQGRGHADRADVC